MLSEQIAELELENKELKGLLKQVNEDVAKPKKCEKCKYYIQHYGANKAKKREERATTR